jgi:farnesyl-diphosphate farnesyltransferase
MTIRTAPPRAAAPVRDPDPGDVAYQRAILGGVSRTFALTIPVLPAPLRDVVTNGYLLCRIADTIEDEPALSGEDRRRFHARFAEAVAGDGDGTEFGGELHACLSERTLPAERDLVRDTPRVLRVTHGFPERQHLARCVRVMCAGMSSFERQGRGLADVAELRSYCYFVAGVVGEMLTELFCAYSPEIEARRDGLQRTAVSFGLGLQMTNILKDVWEDLDRGYCWLPRELFLRHGFDLAELAPGQRSAAFEAGLGELIGIAHGHLCDALDYTLLLPAREKGIRRFCLWALGMALLTLRRIDRRRSFGAAREVKISRRAVKATVLVANAATSRDRILRGLFALSAAGLPRPTTGSD